MVALRSSFLIGGGQALHSAYHKAGAKAGHQHRQMPVYELAYDSAAPQCHILGCENHASCGWALQVRRCGRTSSLCGDLTQILW